MIWKIKLITQIGRTINELSLIRRSKYNSVTFLHAWQLSERYQKLSEMTFFEKNGHAEGVSGHKKGSSGSFYMKN